MQPTQEQWRPIVGYEGSYEVSDMGRVRSVDRLRRDRWGWRTVRGQILVANLSTWGYPQVNLLVACARRTLRVHSLVAAAFLGPRPDGMEICHNDGDKTNNNAENLRYDTKRANSADTVKHGTAAWLHRNECKNGHPFPATEPGVWRSCKICVRERMRKYRAAKGVPQNRSRWIA